MQHIQLTQIPVAEVIAQTLEVLRRGGLVIFPTETTYGAGVLATNQSAVDKLLAFKSRREGKPLSIAVTDLAMAQKYVDVNESARKLYERFLPGPVTVVSRGLGKVAQGVESEFGTLGVRIPDYQLVLDLLKKLGEPITATSANASGAKRPYNIEDVFDGLSEKQKSLIDLVIDAGELPHNSPSTVIDTTLSTPVVFRQGEVQMASAEKLISHSEAETKSIAQRLMLKHWNDVKEGGLVIGLNGSLGMGKTLFTKGVAEFLHIKDTITSPTYSYVQEYEFHRHGVTGKLFHFDIWKVESEAEMERLQLPKLLQPNHVVVIEWVNQMQNYIKKVLTNQSILYIEITFSGADDQRTLAISSTPASSPSLPKK